MEKEEVRKSVEVRFYRFNTLLFLILYLVIVAMFVAITFGVGLPLPGALHFVLAMVGIATVVFLPFMIFYLIRWVGPIIHAQDYVKQEVAFGISGPLINGMNYFPLTLTIDGVQTSKDTHAFFIQGSWFLERYVAISNFANCDGEIAYDAKRDRLLVLKSLNPKAEQPE